MRNTHDSSDDESPGTPEIAGISSLGKRKHDFETEKAEHVTPDVSDYGNELDKKHAAHDSLHFDEIMFIPDTEFDPFYSFSILEPCGTSLLKYHGEDQACFRTTQLLVDQLILENYAFLNESGLARGLEHSMCGFQTKQAIDTFCDAVSNLFPQAERYNLSAYADIDLIGPDINFQQTLKSRENLPDQRALAKSKKTPGLRMNAFKLLPPSFRVSRNQASTDILPSALHFWEELSLEPPHKGKSIIAYCVYPANDNVQRGVDTFLLMMESAYRSCNLGTHVTAIDPMGKYNACVGVPIDCGDDEVTERLDNTCEMLGEPAANKLKTCC